MKHDRPMTLKGKSICCFFVVVTLSACGDSKNKGTNNEVINQLAAKYGTVADWDTSLSYTSHYQKMFIEDKKLLLFNGRIYDIVKEDSSYIVKVLDEREDAIHNFLAVISFTHQQIAAMLEIKESDSGIFVIQVSKVTTSNPSIRVDEASDGESESSYTHLSDDADQMITVFKGKIIDVRLD
jgi:hypothetical protein